MALLLYDTYTSHAYQIMHLEPSGEWLKRIRLPIMGPIGHYYFMILSILSLFLIPNVLSIAYAERIFYSIQIGAFKNLDYAVVETNRLKRLGCDAFYRHETIKNKGKWYRVYIERYGSRGEAEKEAKRLTHLGILSYYYIRALNGEEESTLDNNSEQYDRLNRESNLFKGNGSTSDHQSRQPQKKHEEVIEKADTPLVIKDITFKLEKGGKETVFIQSSRYFSPTVFFALQGERPRLVIDVENTTSFEKGLSEIPVSGELIKQIQIQLHHDSKTLEVVVNLYASKNYEVTQIFYKAENIYAVELVAKQVNSDAQEDKEIEPIDIIQPEDPKKMKILLPEQDEELSKPVTIREGEKLRIAQAKAKFPSVGTEVSRIISLVESWRRAWENKRLNDYTAYYHPAFKSEGKDLTAWKRYKGKLNNRYRRIIVKISGLKAKVEDKKAWAYFRQRYRADSYHDDGYKLIEFKRKGGSWKIFRERWFAERPDSWPT